MNQVENLEKPRLETLNYIEAKLRVAKSLQFYDEAGGKYLGQGVKHHVLADDIKRELGSPEWLKDLYTFINYDTHQKTRDRFTDLAEKWIEREVDPNTDHTKVGKLIKEVSDLTHDGLNLREKEAVVKISQHLVEGVAHMAAMSIRARGEKKESFSEAHMNFIHNNVDDLSVFDVFQRAADLLIANLGYLSTPTGVIADGIPGSLNFDALVVLERIFPRITVVKPAISEP